MEGDRDGSEAERPAMILPMVGVALSCGSIDVGGTMRDMMSISTDVFFSGSRLGAFGTATGMTLTSDRGIVLRLRLAEIRAARVGV